MAMNLRVIVMRKSRSLHLWWFVEEFCAPLLHSNTVCSISAAIWGQQTLCRSVSYVWYWTECPVSSR